MPVIGRKKINNRWVPYEAQPYRVCRETYQMCVEKYGDEVELAHPSTFADDPDYNGSDGGNRSQRRSPTGSPPPDPRLRNNNRANNNRVDQDALLATIQQAVQQGIAVVQDEFNTRFRELEAQITGRMSGRGVEPAGGAVLGALPVRPLGGEYSTSIPPVAARFSYVKPEIQDLAMCGRLPPNKLPALIDPSDATALKAIIPAEEDNFTLGGVTFAKSSSSNDGSKAINNFIKAIPDITAFTYVWCRYLQFLIGGQDDPLHINAIVAAMTWHLAKMDEFARQYPWPACLRYHYSVQQSRLSDGFVSDAWYKKTDFEIFTKELVNPPRQFAQAQHHPRPTGKGSAAPPPPPASTDPRVDPRIDPSVCRNWNQNKVCAYGNLCRLTHKCYWKSCGSTGHRGLFCPANSVSSSALSGSSPHLTFGFFEQARKLGFSADSRSPPPPRPNTTLAFDIYSTSDAPSAPAVLHVDHWWELLEGYPDRSFVQAICGGIRHGLRVGYVGPLLHSGRETGRNLKTDEAGLAHIRNEIRSRLAASRITIHTPTHPPFTFSPIGTVPKPHSNKFRTIHHLSHPRSTRTSVNDGIDPTTVTLTYEGLDGVFEDIRTARKEGRAVGLWKTDLADAFRHLIVALSQCGLLGFTFEGVNYIDTSLPFGMRSSPFLFNLYAEGFHWVLSLLGITCSHYLDDFFGVCTLGRAPAIIDMVQRVADYLGFKLAPHKVLHGTSIEILGILIDTNAGTASITTERRTRIITDINNVLDRNTASGRELSSIAGHLVFVTRICPPGRAFLRRVYEAISTDPFIFEIRRRLPLSAKKDMIWWRDVLRDWNGVLVLEPVKLHFDIWTDASLTGLGGHLGELNSPIDTFSVRIPSDMLGKDIMFYESLALLHALREWISLFAGGVVTAHIDNQVLVAAIATGSCRHRPTQSLIRSIYHLAMTRDVELRAVWLPSEENILADALSRFDLDTAITFTPNPSISTTLAKPNMSPPNSPSIDDATTTNDDNLIDVINLTSR